MRVRTVCQNDACHTVIDTDPLDHETARITCPRCRCSESLNLPDAFVSEQLVRCPCCGSEELFIRKDFPQKIGLYIVVIAAVASIFLFATGRLISSLAVLAAVVVIDAVVYLFVSKLTVCYRCRAEFRDTRLNPAHQGFDLATAEKYRS